jgi:RNA polymerase sigma-70 factor (ECF subfamily)
MSTPFGSCARTMASSTTLLAACSETAFSSEGSGHDSADREPSANRGAKENSTKGTGAEDDYSSSERNGRFYGQYHHRASIRAAPVFLGVSCMAVTFPTEKRFFLGQVLDEVFDGLYGYAMVLSRDRTEAEDLVQETCVRAVQAIESLRPDSNVKGWLFTILRNIWLNQLRRRRAAPKIVELDVDESTAELAVERSKDPHALYVSKVEREQVREAIEQLSEEFREIIVLREYGELSYQEIANVLGCPAGTVMSRLGRARSKLRSLLSGSFRSPDGRAKGAAE